MAAVGDESGTCNWSSVTQPPVTTTERWEPVTNIPIQSVPSTTWSWPIKWSTTTSNIREGISTPDTTTTEPSSMTTTERVPPSTTWSQTWSNAPSDPTPTVIPFKCEEMNVVYSGEPAFKKVKKAKNAEICKKR